MSEKTWVIEAKRCPTDYEPETEWHVHARFTDEVKANAEFDLQADLNGHNTYFRLVQVKRKILLEC